ncbi:Kinesin-like protein kif24 [Mortierella hygrophila]|uniref:Kinesin-like protein kif24 n=1 Tax=Mortierella hygrophila TaxID=979708 RepID=A0A9P6F0Y9_9FUNG|nr:Kinesin-like protein kif24 [Mortierella hygrophila]
MQDYNTLGVTSMEDRRKLFQLIQTIKAQYVDNPEPSPPMVTASIPHSSAAPPLTNDSDDISRGYGAQALSEMSKRSSDARLSMSMGRRSGANMLNNLSHSKSLSTSMASSYQLQEQERLQQQQQQQFQQQQQYQQQQQQQRQAQEYDYEMQQQQQQYQQYQQQQQLLQQQQYRQQQRELMLQQQQQQQQQQQMMQMDQQRQYADGRGFKAASDDEEDPIPVQEAQRGLNAYSVPSGGRGTLGRNSSYTVNDMMAKIRVCVRKRPLSSKEIHRGEKDMASVSGRQLAVDEPKVRLDMTKFIERHKFVFDEVFDSDATNEDVYRRTAYPLVQYLFEGGKATCFAYGQTGSGKTYTMLDDSQGLYVLAARDIFVKLRSPENSHLSIYMGFYEIYQGQLHDLLNERKKLHAREDGKNGVVVAGLKEFEIVNVEGLMQVFAYGNNARSTGSTRANADSSRSHAIMQIVLKDRASKTAIGKLSFIDLAGSERGADRGETDVKTRMEGAEINKSLLALKECIRALDQDKKHTPFRQSKLTQVLKDSFVGNSRTCMIATISPNNSNSEHTLNTLRYADRVKELKAEGGAKGTAPSDTENYMDDTEGELGGTTSAYDDDDFISSTSDNIADETIDLLDDEEFPHALDQEEMDPHPLATSTYDHELEEPPSPGHILRGGFDDGEEINSRRMSYQQQQAQAQRQLLQQQQLQHQQNQLQQQLQQQKLDAEKYREPPVPSSSASPRLKQSTASLKGSKPEAFSRLPMPRGNSGQQSQPRTASPTSNSPTATSIPPSQRQSLSNSNNRRNSSNPSPPLSSRSGRDSRTSPDGSSSNEAASTTTNTSTTTPVTANGIHKSVSRHSPSNLKRPSVTTLRQSGGVRSSTGSSAPTSALSAGPTSAIPDSHFGLNSPTSPKISTPTSATATVTTTPTTATTTTGGGSPSLASSSSSLSSSTTPWTFSIPEMQSFVREHRAELQECSELTKRETKLLKDVMVGMSSPAMAQTTGYGGDQESFQRYLDELDEIVDEKLITIVAMSQKLKALRSQML